MNPILKCDIIFPGLCVLGGLIAMIIILVRNKKNPKESVSFWETTRVKVPLCVIFILIMSYLATLGVMDFCYKDNIIYQGEYLDYVRNKDPKFYFTQDRNEYHDFFYSYQLNHTLLAEGETYRVTAGKRTKRILKVEKIDETTGEIIEILDSMD